MKIDYQSSSLTLIVKYFIAPLLVILFAYELFMVSGGGDLGEFSPAELPLMSWAVGLAVFSAIFFKNVKITTQNIVIGRGKKQQVLDYKDIIWIVQTYIGRPTVYLKYRDQKSGDYRIISFIPEIYRGAQFKKILFHPYRELEVLDFVRTRIRITQGKYNAAAEPSQWVFLWIILISLLPFAIASILLIK